VVDGGEKFLRARPRCDSRAGGRLRVCTTGGWMAAADPSRVKGDSMNLRSMLGARIADVYDADAIRTASYQKVRFRAIASPRRAERATRAVGQLDQNLSGVHSAAQIYRRQSRQKLRTTRFAFVLPSRFHAPEFPPPAAGSGVNLAADGARLRAAVSRQPGSRRAIAAERGRAIETVISPVESAGHNGMPLTS